MVSMAVLFIVFGIGMVVSICTRCEALAYAQKYLCVDTCGLCKSGGRNIYILCEGLYALSTVFRFTSVRDFVICLCLGATSAG